MLFKCKKDTDNHYSQLHRMLSEMLEQGDITLYAGDCRFEDAAAELNSEKHYSVCFYLRCKTCGEIYFFGNFIRGPAKYYKVADITEKNLKTFCGDERASISPVPERRLILL